MADKSGTILVVDDDIDVLQAARIYLKQHFADVHTEKDPGKIPNLLANDNYDLILLDMNFTRDISSGQEGFHWLSKILEIDPSAVVILITAFGDVELAVRGIKEGATDFVLKPWQNEKLLATIFAGMNLRRSRTEVANLKSRQKHLATNHDNLYRGFIGASPPMQKVFASIEKVAGTEANVLILGESGTGKELVARELHRQSRRADEVFTTVDMGALSETLFESELFGHKKGAFTDAREDRPGRFEIASGGTLFLDEIGNLPLPLQGKLLSVLENRTVTRIGSNTAVPIDVRLISATNMQPARMVEEKRFRQDLLYRIRTIEIKLPPLRERDEDIPLLVEHFLGQYCRKYQKPVKRIPALTFRKLSKYRWPGNVRELQHAVERAVIMNEGDTLQPEDFFLVGPEMTREGMVLDTYNLDEVEKGVIRRAITKHKGNLSQAAKELGLTRASLYRRMQKYDL